jgi:hypothetical protein
MERENIISSRKENARLRESPLSRFRRYMTIMEDSPWTVVAVLKVSKARGCKLYQNS